MSGRKVGQKVFDWTKVASRISEDLRGEFIAFRGRHEACRASLNAYPEKREPFNWDYYKRNISKPNLVEEFKKQYEAISVPYPKDLASPVIEKAQKIADAEAKKAIEESAKRLAELKVELDKINAEKPYEEMTLEEYLADKPELEKQAEEDAMNHKWKLGLWQ